MSTDSVVRGMHHTQVNGVRLAVQDSGKGVVTYDRRGRSGSERPGPVLVTSGGQSPPIFQAVLDHLVRLLPHAHCFEPAGAGRLTGLGARR